MSNSTPTFRFGDFEFDTRSGELNRHGCKVVLQDQPIRALLFLLKRPGELVMREEFVRQLWSENTFVDFDRGLNKIINKLRVALVDDADEPRYIETLPQRGYRFIAPVEIVSLGRDPLQPTAVLKIDSLAVLPLENLSGDPAQEYFSDGMTEELISALAKISSLRVISRTSVMRYKGVRQSLLTIARELRVDAIVEGSVSRLGDKVRIIAQLIYVPEDRHLWSGRYERDVIDILSLQAEVAQNITGRIRKLVDPVHFGVAQARRIHPPAFEAYLKGNFFRNKLTPVDLDKSINFLTQAIELDPSFAPAYGALARCYQFVGIFGIRHPAEVFIKVRANAVKALELDESLASAHIALASANVFERWDWATAEAECRLATELSPNDSLTHGHLGDYLSITGRHSEAIEEFGGHWTWIRFHRNTITGLHSLYTGRADMRSPSHSVREFWKSTFTTSMCFGFLPSR